MSKTLYLEHVAGIAGDMFAASFVDAGVVTAEELRDLPSKLGLGGVEVKITAAIKATMKATHVNVVFENESWKSLMSAGGTHTHEHSNLVKVSAKHSSVKPAHGHAHGADGHWHTHYTDIERFLKNSKLDAPVKNFACRVFALIAEAEADAHGIPVSEVAFHEVGTVDSILDVVMAAYCVDKVGASRVLSTPVKLGRGLITIEHGTQPVPPPASARLVKNMPIADIPEAITRANVELSTPTGLAIVRALEPQFVSGLPGNTAITAQGMGAGTMDLATYPNVFRVMVLEEDNAGIQMLDASILSLPYEHDSVVEIRSNFDDETPERLGWIVESLFELGALDAWQTPVTGKKGRVAIELAVLCDVALAANLADFILAKTTTFGLRYQTWSRLKLARRFEERATKDGVKVTHKVGLDTRGVELKAKPEFDALKKHF